MLRKKFWAHKVSYDMKVPSFFIHKWYGLSSLCYLMSVTHWNSTLNMMLKRYLCIMFTNEYLVENRMIRKHFENVYKLDKGNPIWKRIKEKKNGVKKNQLCHMFRSAMKVHISQPEMPGLGAEFFSLKVIW